MDANIIIKIVFTFIVVILFINLLKFLANFFSNRKRYNEVCEVRTEINSKIRPRLGSLEQKFEKDENSGDDFGKYVYKLFKDEFKNKNEKIVEREVCKCCQDYENANCKEDFCLNGVCNKV